MYRALLFVILLTPIQTVRGEVQGPDRAYLSADLGLAIFGEAAHREYLARAFSLSAHAGARWGDWGAYLQLESASWFAAEGSRGDELTGVINLGVGGEYLYASGFVRTAIATGPSFLVTGTEIDELGQVGFFFELRPAGLRWSLNDRWVLGLDPLVLAIAAPVLEGIPLIELEYRTTIVGEYLF